jgi:hypothetical protein
MYHCISLVNIASVILVGGRSLRLKVRGNGKFPTTQGPFLASSADTVPIVSQNVEQSVLFRGQLDVSLHLASQYCLGHSRRWKESALKSSWEWEPSWPLKRTLCSTSPSTPSPASAATDTFTVVIPNYPRPFSCVICRYPVVGAITPVCRRRGVVALLESHTIPGSHAVAVHSLNRWHLLGCVSESQPVAISLCIPTRPGRALQQLLGYTTKSRHGRR